MVHIESKLDAIVSFRADFFFFLLKKVLTCLTDGPTCVLES
jgi:hypothetical protein